MNMNMKNGMYLIGAALLSSVMTVAAYKIAGLDRKEVVFQEVSNSDGDTNPAFALVKRQNTKPGLEDVPFDFTEAAEKTTPSVVHIVATQKADRRTQTQVPDMFREFFGDEFFRNPQGPQESQGSGSGVIISQDGYIVTNNHVVDNASKIEVILNDKKTFEAKVIGVDPSTDLAVIKVETTGLPNIILGNSDDVRVGQWVLAVGNPFNLESTVTAGIVSAKGRNLNILRDKDRAPIESFIQTDAAVNPGNSGGALINPKGELIGINTAIATPTGTYAGYSFAVPINIVRKVMKDIIEYGSVQRAYLGITIRELDGNYAKEKGLKGITEGVRIETVTSGSAAEEAGLKEGDIIVKIDGKIIKTSPQLLEEIAKRRPGNKIQVEAIRDGSPKTFEVFLKSQTGATQLVKTTDTEVMRKLGAEFENLSKEELKKLGVEYGIRVSRLYNGKLRNETDIQEGFVITKMGGEPIKSVDEFVKKLENTQGGIFLSGVYPDSDGEFYYAFGM
ncbi:MAG: Do family serine endopeptidase [Microscillaceae bacterium]|nr:Do family serine endopeptidase [Microscillaceae bacterium]